ncbi:hypothetical protein BFC17_17415 [Alteromonas lipolytica]|uniref:Uncharacterized protein n=1 Tax=Alteromonas lipolytica TaxID=1856405 RepID=A0A1E8FH99_9ALTE|nr:hypothetical protein BFC17_17415 [Alteromonas lipolytica]
MTGFTLGFEIYDRYEVVFARKKWWHDKYYAAFSYKLKAGFGSRWPFKLKAETIVTKVFAGENNQVVDYPANLLCQGVNVASRAERCAFQGKATFTAYAVENAKTQFYKDVGLPNDKLFKGKEFVFTLGATCRFHASIPGPNIGFSCPDSLKGFDFSLDHPTQLGRTQKTLVQKVIKGKDLGFGVYYGTGYAVINPGAKLVGKDGKIKFDVKYNHAVNAAGNQNINSLTVNGGSKTLTVEENVNQGERVPWGVELTNPEYSVSASLVPIAEIEIGVDLGVYTWDEVFGPVEFNDLALNLGEFKFERHEGSTNKFKANIGVRYSPR